MLYLCSLNCGIMKKRIVLITLLMASIGLMAQETQQAVKGAHPYKTSENEAISTDFAHWSIIPHIGFNVFDGDFDHEKKHSVAVHSAGINFEYAFTPVWAIGLEYMFSQYHVTGNTSYQQTVDTMLNGHMHKAGAYVSMDLVNLFYPKAKKRIVSIQPMLGAGYAFYKTDVMYYDDDKATHERGNTKNYINSDGVLGPDKMDKYKGAFYIQAGANVEFNLNRSLALGIRAAYHYFMVDYIDGRGYAGKSALASKNNDGIVDVTLNMRIKLAAVSKSHVRNVSNDTWMGGYGSSALAAAPAAPAQNQAIQYVHDTVIIQRDSIIVRERMVERVVGGGRSGVGSEAADDPWTQGRIAYIYFDEYKSNLNDDALITAQQVADHMNAHPDLYAVVTAYCDNTGTVEQNYILSDRRAKEIADELQKEYKISAGRIYAVGQGKVVGGRSKASYSPNRRAMIRLVDKETFDRLKAELQKAKESR